MAVRVCYALQSSLESAPNLYTQWCTFLGKHLKFPCESRTDGWGKDAL